MKKSVNSLYESRKFIRIILMLLSLVISITTLYLSQLLVVKIAGEEKKKMEMWAEAESILSDPFSEGDLGFQLRVVQSNTTIPASKGTSSRIDRLVAKARGAASLASKARETTPEITNSSNNRHGLTAIIGHTAHSTGVVALTCQPHGTKNIPI